MHARIVRFTDVTPEQIQEIVQRIEESDGPPPGVDSNAIKLFHDESQGTAVVTVFFDDEQKMRDADSVFQQMDAGDTPGSRASVDMTEIKVEREAGDR
jgi:hypothetical protein